MNQLAQNPIGIFDSGVGGLTVASAIHNMLPEESIIYVGDTAHLPYGDKSIESIRTYSQRIASFLLEQNCKLILIACNTASAAAYSVVEKHVGNQAIVIDVINPVVDYIVKKEKIKKVGVIGTKLTINSNTYPAKIKEISSCIDVRSLATPLLVPMIEEGFIFDNISNSIIEAYLSREILKDIDSLVLGCTHYPIIKNQIRKFYNFRVDIIDSSKVVAKYLKDVLSEKNLLNSNNHNVNNRFYVTDYTEMFKNISEMFFEDEVNLEKINLWQ